MPTNGTTKLVPTFEVLINGNTLPAQASADITHVAVHDDVEAPGMFTLCLTNWDMVQLQVTWVDNALFNLGNTVEIQMGYVDSLETLLVGEITGLEPQFLAGEPPTLLVRGYDRRHRLLRGDKTRSFLRMKDSDIAAQIASAHGLIPRVEDTGVILDYVLQHNQTDWAFLLARARRIGYEVMVVDKTLYFRPPQYAQGAVLTLARDTDILEFSPRLTTLNQTSKTTVRSWSVQEKKPLLGQGSIGDETTTMGGVLSGPATVNRAFGPTNTISVDHPTFSQAETDQIARGQFNDMALGYISAEGVSIGRTDLRAGIVIAMGDLGQRFSGRYYVVATAHTYRPNRGYRTAFTVRRNAA